MLGKLLRQLNVELDRFNVLFGESHGPHHTDLNALVTILDAADRQEPITPGRLAAPLDLSVSATTAPLERLESLGHVARERSETDRRRGELDIHDTARQVGGDFYRPLMRELSGVRGSSAPSSEKRSGSSSPPRSVRRGVRGRRSSGTESEGGAALPRRVRPGPPGKHVIPPGNGAHGIRQSPS